MLNDETNEHLNQIAAAIVGLDVEHPVRLGIDGFCASGKTTLSGGLAEILRKLGWRVIQVSLDDFQNPPEVRWQLGENSPEGFFRHAIDFESVRAQLLLPLSKAEGQFRVSTYDIRNLRPNLSAMLPPSSFDAVLIDGLFLHVPSLRDLLDYSVFLDTNYETCIRRARLRNQEQQAGANEVESLYRRRYVPGFELYRQAVCPEEWATIVIQTNT